MTTLDALAYVHIPKDKKKVGELPQENSEMSVLELKRRVLLGSSLESGECVAVGVFEYCEVASSGLLFRHDDCGAEV